MICHVCQLLYDKVTAELFSTWKRQVLQRDVQYHESMDGFKKECDLCSLVLEQLPEATRLEIRACSATRSGDFRPDFFRIWRLQIFWARFGVKKIWRLGPSDPRQDFENLDIFAQTTTSIRLNPT